MRKILGSIKECDAKYRLIENGDVIAVGISGGKDSLVLFQALHYYQQYSKKQFKIIGIHIDVGFSGENFQFISEWAKQKEYQLLIEKTAIYRILEKYKNHDNICCSRCSNLKKGALVKAAKKYGCNKIALGHHYNDGIETLFLNIFYGGKCRSFLPKMFLNRESITMIRPLFLEFESEIRRTAEKLKLPVMISGCPREGLTKRSELKNFINEIKKNFPDSEKNLKNALIDLTEKEN